jgi:hypothetical protein
MIKAHCFTKDWINGFRQQKHLRRINPPVLEKMIHALSLLQQLKAHGLDFTFKGGTSLVLLLAKSRRFSLDIDIITTQSREGVEAVLDKVVINSHFNKWKLQDRRSYKEGIPKAHYEFDYVSVLNQSANVILLDILFDKIDYPRLRSVPVQSEWLESEEVLEVTVPSIESILGDKLTAFAPNTVGILYGTDKEQEIIKQLFDISCLFDEAENVEEIALSFEKIGNKEIAYRGLEIGLEDILNDIFITSLLIAKRNKHSAEPDKARFTALANGIRRFESFLIAENFKMEDAVLAAGKAAYLVKQIKNNDYSAIEKFNDQDISKLEITGELNFLNKLKKSRDKAAFFYWYKAVE